MPIVIRSTHEGFRRCGIAHAKAAVTYPDERFTDEEVAQLKAEPRLLVEVTEDKKEPGKMNEADALSLLEAARKAIADGDVIGSGAPKTEAMAKILGVPFVSAAQRDDAWATLQKENQE
ncbi:hypothetical protein DSLASN_02420 [Desulfoluna limicola]|uniref:Mu-like prophage FluMu N-terminal domain-containing protein n=1 Tax=Desulfoluna limicola TaxID=2810562 RepID=A0ABM7PBY4_9BACT|nr:HI1506-related protein [Desulfoluna limicola]BCS94610.1 hypothetical protein DSLASN_02420 [Desulfoluna limicola]